MAHDEYALSARTASGRFRGPPRLRGTRKRAITSPKAGASPACPAVRWKPGAGSCRRPRAGSSLSARHGIGRWRGRPARRPGPLRTGARARPTAVGRARAASTSTTGVRNEPMSWTSADTEPSGQPVWATCSSGPGVRHRPAASLPPGTGTTAPVRCPPRRGSATPAGPGRRARERAQVASRVLLPAPGGPMTRVRRVRTPSSNLRNNLVRSTGTPDTGGTSFVAKTSPPAGLPPRQ